MDAATIFTSLLISIAGAFATSYFAYRFYSPKLKAELQKEYKSRFNERKWEAYTEFANIIYQVLDNNNEEDFEEDLPTYTSQLHEFLSKLWIVGSDEVVNSVNEWLRYSRKHSYDEQKTGESLVRLINIVIEMRKDLGYKESQIRPKDLLTTFITDVDDHL